MALRCPRGRRCFSRKIVLLSRRFLGGRGLVRRRTTIEYGKTLQVSWWLDAGFCRVRLPGDERENGFLAVLGIRHSPRSLSTGGGGECLVSRFVVFKRGIALAVIRFAFVAAALCGFTVQGRAGVMRTDVASSAYQAFAADPIFQSVGSVAGWDGANWRLVGSGVLIDDDWVMLTGHQLDNGFSSYRFSLGNDLFLPNTGRSVASSYYVAGSGGTLFSPDLALMHLSTPLSGKKAKVYDGDDLSVGMRVVMAGYGSPAYFPTGELAFDGKKRAGENIIKEIGPNAALGADRFLWDFGPAWGTPSLPLEMGGSGGDSGGGTFAFIDGQWQLVGIMDQRVGFTDTIALRPTAYREWTNQIMGVPEPSSLLLTLSGMAGAWMLFRRRLS